MPARKISEVELEECSDDEVLLSAVRKKPKTSNGVLQKKGSKSNIKSNGYHGAFSCRFLGNPFSKAEACRRWPHRYPQKKKEVAGKAPASEKKKKADEDNLEQDEDTAKCMAHYSKAEVAGITYDINDCAYVHAGGGPDYIGRIVEFYKKDDGSFWFTAQWFFRAQDTAIGEAEGQEHDPKRVFYSEVKDANPLECLEQKLKIIKLSPLQFFNVNEPKSIPKYDYYYDMGYDYAFSRFYSMPSDSKSAKSDTISLDALSSQPRKNESKDAELSLLDLYSGCGGMSTGLSMGASLSGVKLVTRWAVDINEHACKSLKNSHPETEVRNEAAEDFLALIKQWHQLCAKYSKEESVEDTNIEKDKNGDSIGLEEGEFEVEKIVGIRYVDPSGVRKSGLEFKVHWKGYTESDDSWEPSEGLEDCEDSIKKFVIQGKKAQLLPLPGNVDVLCGGPPCQGASGFNRFRNKENPLADSRNKQMNVYMDIVNFLRPRFVLMENVVDILKFAQGYLGKYALSQLVKMHYQAKLGLMIAGCYGLPQIRMRVFLWGASPLEILPPYPLPTHDVLRKGGTPQEWERNLVAYNETQKPNLMKALTLVDAISDLPRVENFESRNEMPYGKKPCTDFQWFIRLSKEVLTGESKVIASKKQHMVLYDHRPLCLNADDYDRTCHIPHAKGANFRDLPGVNVDEKKIVSLDPKMERVLLKSGKPLVPDYAITFVNGRSSKPFRRLWWDETVPTVVTRAEPHNQAILHPEQDRVLTIRENARLQGFPDYYQLFGPVKQRYIQVGNAVAVPVARALGYTLGCAVLQSCPDSSVMELPSKFPHGLIFTNSGTKSVAA